MCIGVLHLYLCATCMWCLLRPDKFTKIPGTGVTVGNSHMSTILWVLRIGSRSSAKAVGALHGCDISLAP